MKSIGNDGHDVEYTQMKRIAQGERSIKEIKIKSSWNYNNVMTPTKLKKSNSMLI